MTELIKTSRVLNISIIITLNLSHHINKQMSLAGPTWSITSCSSPECSSPAEVTSRAFCCAWNLIQNSSPLHIPAVEVLHLIIYNQSFTPLHAGVGSSPLGDRNTYRHYKGRAHDPRQERFPWTSQNHSAASDCSTGNTHHFNTRDVSVKEDIYGIDGLQLPLKIPAVLLQSDSRSVRSLFLHQEALDLVQGGSQVSQGHGVRDRTTPWSPHTRTHTPHT